MRIKVDYDLCESNGLCMDAAPEVFEVRDDDLMYLLVEEPDVALHPKVLQAISRCPKRALSLQDDGE